MQLDWATIEMIGTALGTILGCFYTYQKISKNFENKKKEHSDIILQQAKEEMALIKFDLESKINAVRVQLSNHEASVNKDLDHMRETYNGEIRNLGEKIEDLRSDLKNQHGQLVNLLTKMIENRN